MKSTIFRLEKVQKLQISSTISQEKHLGFRTLAPERHATFSGAFDKHFVEG